MLCGGNLHKFYLFMLCGGNLHKLYVFMLCGGNLHKLYVFMLLSITLYFKVTWLKAIFKILCVILHHASELYLLARFG